MYKYTDCQYVLIKGTFKKYSYNNLVLKDITRLSKIPQIFDGKEHIYHFEPPTNAIERETEKIMNGK